MTWVALYTGMGEPNSHCRHQKPGGIIDIIFQLEEKRQQGWSSLFTAKNESEKRWKALEDPIPLKASYRIIFVSHSLQTHVSFPSIIEEVCSKTSTPNGWAELRRTQNYSLTSCTLFWGKILHTPCCRFLPAYFFSSPFCMKFDQTIRLFHAQTAWVCVPALDWSHWNPFPRYFSG